MMAFVGKWMQELDCGERNAGMGLEEGGGRERWEKGNKGETEGDNWGGGGGGGWRDTEQLGGGGVGEGVQHTKRLERHLLSEPHTYIYSWGDSAH